MLRLINYILVFSYFFLFSISTLALQTEWSAGNESQVRIISPVLNNDKNEIYIGLEYKLKDGWKTYWKSSGEGGFPQEINWENSKNIKDLEILWPTPKYFEILGFTSIGYVEKVVFPIKIKIQDINKETLIDLKINYLICEEICVPGNAHLELIIPPGEGVYSDQYYNVQKALSSIPRKIEENNYDEIYLSAKALENKKNISIIVNADSDNLIVNPKIFLHSEFGLPVIKPIIKFSSNLKSFEARFDFDKKNISKKNFNINIIYNDNNNSFEIDKNVTIKKFSKISFLNNSIIYILLVSLLGGLILNVMPCVLPVLSIKILSVLRNPKDKIIIRKSFLFTSLGIISSFAILSIALIFLRNIGINIVWGMQFQQPIFLLLIAIILMLFSLNLFGFFEFSLPQFLSPQFIKSYNKKNYITDFFNGFFATVLATPCSAPFVGTAITVAFTQSSLTMLGIFIFMGFGMASPFLIVSFFPSLAKFLPKPGKWMQNVKYFLGILLFGTFIWIISILLSNYSLFSFNDSQNENDWLDFTNINLEKLRKENNNQIIFVDITADWCATCQFNKINVLNSKEIKEKFKKFSIIKVRGDWTKPNKKISDYLQSFNRFGIPFNVIYIGNNSNVFIFSELLSKKQIIDYLDEIEIILKD